MSSKHRIRMSGEIYQAEAYARIQGLTIWVDGASAGVPPVGAAALVLSSGGEPLELTYPCGHANSNQAEYWGIIHGLKLAEALGDHEILMLTDSQLCVGHLVEGKPCKAASLKEYYEIAKRRLARCPHVTLRWIPRAENGHADRLAKSRLFDCLAANKEPYEPAITD